MLKRSCRAVYATRAEKDTGFECTVLGIGSKYLLGARCGCPWVSCTSSQLTRMSRTSAPLEPEGPTDYR